jgi:hypothetical protein
VKVVPFPLLEDIYGYRIPNLVERNVRDAISVEVAVLRLYALDRFGPNLELTKDHSGRDFVCNQWHAIVDHHPSPFSGDLGTMFPTGRFFEDLLHVINFIAGFNLVFDGLVFQLSQLSDSSGSFYSVPFFVLSVPIEDELFPELGCFRTLSLNPFTLFVLIDWSNEDLLKFLRVNVVVFNESFDPLED